MYHVYYVIIDNNHQIIIKIKIQLKHLKKNKIQ